MAFFQCLGYVLDAIDLVSLLRFYLIFANIQRSTLCFALIAVINYAQPTDSVLNVVVMWARLLERLYHQEQQTHLQLNSLVQEVMTQVWSLPRSYCSAAM